MSNKKQEIASAEVESTQQENNQVVTTQSNAVVEVNSDNFDGLDIEALLEKSSSMDKLETVLSLSPESITLEKVGESFRGIFMGYGEMTVNDANAEEGKRTLECAKFLINKKMCINGGTVLVSELHNANVKPGTPLEVTYTEKKGNVKIYRITLLG
jgi:hypothetical protein